jgi:CMP-N-acetylneuraminic acid synthetase
MKIFTIIKNNSERVPGKNFALIAGVPLWEYALRKLSKYEVFVNTDSINVINDINSDPTLSFITAIRRDIKYVDWESDAATRGSPVLSMFMDFAVNQCDDDNEIIALTHVTTPFLRISTLDKAAGYLDKGFKTVHSVSVKQDICWQPSGQGYVSSNHVSGSVSRTQDLTPFLLKFGDRMVPPYFLYKLEDIENIEIDTPYDLKLAKCIGDNLNEFY